VSVTIKPRSRLQFGNLLSIDGFEFWDTLQLPQLQAQPDDAFYTVLGPDRIDLLAYKFYGDAVLWWVIALANDLELLPSDLNPGLVLRIPSLRYVQLLFKQKANVGAGTTTAALQTTSGTSGS
jgi:hypothetical protein